MNPAMIATGPCPGLIALFAEIFCMGADAATRPEVIEVYSRPRLLWHALRNQSLTQTEDNALRAALGDDAMQHLYWDTMATDGRIVVFAMRCKGGPDTDRLPFGFYGPTDIYRNCLNVEERQASHAAYEAETPVPPPSGQLYATVLGRVFAEAYLAKIRLLPNARFCGPAAEFPREVYFRFDGGAGALMPVDIPAEQLARQIAEDAEEEEAA